MSEINFHLMDAATGRFLRRYGDRRVSREYLAVDGDGPAYTTADIADIHRLVRLAPDDRTPFGLPVMSDIEDEFFCVAAVRTYGSVVPGGDTVLLSTDLMKVELEDLKTPPFIRSRDFKSTPAILRKRYASAAILDRISSNPAMKPEFVVFDGSQYPVGVGEFIMSQDMYGAQIGEVLGVTPLPDSWPLEASRAADGLMLAIVDYASSAGSYRVCELSLEERPVPRGTRPPSF
jgi:hypothetical protein